MTNTCTKSAEAEIGLVSGEIGVPMKGQEGLPRTLVRPFPAALPESTLDPGIVIPDRYRIGRKPAIGFFGGRIESGAAAIILQRMELARASRPASARDGRGGASVRLLSRGPR